MTERKKPLRAVEPGEVAPAPPAPDPIPSLMDAVESGDPLAIARAQRRDIARDLPDEKGPAKAALHRQLAALTLEIGRLELVAMQAAEEDGDAGTVEDEPWNEEAL